MNDTIRLSLDGYTDIPSGKIASVVTYLEMRAPPPPAGQPSRPDLGLDPLPGVAAERYLALFRTIGERWLWFGRLRLPPAELASVLDDPGIAAFALTRSGIDCGLLEIDFRVPGEAEIVYFGLCDGATGQGIGRWLMARALSLAWSRPLRRVWLHTCHLDHPGAIAFYRRAGFTPYKLAIEVCDDPRLDGTLPPHAAAHLPLLAPS